MVLRINIAIDGPAGAGKSTVARKVADKLGEGYIYVDTGALYRGITYWALKENIDINNEDEVMPTIDKIDLKFDFNQNLLINGYSYIDEIRTPIVSQNVSTVASYPKVRRYILELLRELASNGGVVMDGRDIGTFVLPDAEVKIFLTATIEQRANRRATELSNKNYNISLDVVKEEILLRDNRDSNRKESPLLQAKDAVLIDTTELSIDEVVDKIIDYCYQEIRRKNIVI